MHNTRCTNRSAWRVPPGKPAEPLSPHYQLDCDFGTSLVIVWKTDGTEPLYLCEEHARELGGHAGRSAGAGPARNRVTKEPSVPAVDRKPAPPAPPSADQSTAIDRQISELEAQLESILASSQAAISVASIIDAPLEQAALEIIDHAGMTEAQKDAAIEHLGALQESIKQGSGQDITPSKAHRIRQTLGICLTDDAGNEDKDSPAQRAVYDRLQSAIHAAVPRSKGLEERIANLCKIKASRKTAPARELESTVA